MYERILVPTDASPAAVAAAQHAISLGLELGSELFMLQVIPPYQIPMYLEYAALNIYPEEEYIRQSRQAADVHLGALAGQARAAGVKCSGKAIFQQNASQAIIDVASDLACQLIVMGSHGRSGLGRLFLGSVTARVLPLSHVPVLVHRATAAELATAEGILAAKAGAPAPGPGTAGGSPPSP